MISPSGSNGQNPVLVSKSLDIYLHLVPGWQREAAEMFARAMGKGGWTEYGQYRRRTDNGDGRQIPVRGCRQAATTLIIP